MGHLSKFLPEHNKNLGRSYMVPTPPKIKLKILNVLLPFQLIYNVRSMAVLANPLAWMARAIGFASFSPLRKFLRRAKIVLLSLLVLQTHNPFWNLTAWGGAFLSYKEMTYPPAIVTFLVPLPPFCYLLERDQLLNEVDRVRGWSGYDFDVAMVIKLIL